MADLVTMTRREILALSVAADVDFRVAADEVAHPERWGEPGPSRARERIRVVLRARSAPTESGSAGAERSAGRVA